MIDTAEASDNKPNLLPQHLAKCRSSGLTDATIRDHGLHSKQDADTIAGSLSWQFGATKIGPCLALPYWHQSGQPHSYLRLRPDRPRTDDRGRVVKYEAPLGISNHIYLPILVRQMIAKPGEPLFITEGELKSLKACQEGIPTIGLPGVWSWGKKVDGKLQPIPDITGINWTGRAVYVVPDSDCVEKESVQLAAYKLAETLLGLGAADVRQIILPHGPNGEKLGLDDYLVLHSKDAFDRLIPDAEPPAEPEPVGVLANTYRRLNRDGDPDTLARSAEYLRLRLARLTDGWPQRVRSNLFAEGTDGKPVWLDSQSTLFAWIQRASKGGAESRSKVEWTDRAKGAISKSEFTAYLEQTAPVHDTVELFPHHEPIPGVYYMHPEVQGGIGAALKSLLDMFSPATRHDRELILAFFATSIWGGPCGKRPAFLFTSADSSEMAGRGIGKSTIPQANVRLFGGRSVTVGERDDMAKFRTRLLSPGASGNRLITIDNIKSLRFSWAEFEEFLTDPTVSGHQLYTGEGSVPNRFTVTLTANGAALSKDIAQRSIPIFLKRPTYSPTWQADLDALIDTRRWELFGDLIAFFRRKPVPLTNYSRWGDWDRDILCRVHDPDHVWNLIAQRQNELDADASEADLIRDRIQTEMRMLTGQSADAAHVRYTAEEITSVINRALGTKNPVPAVTQKIKSLGITGLTGKRTKTERFYVWVGEGAATDRPCHYADLVDGWKRKQNRRDFGEPVWPPEFLSPDRTAEEEG